MRTNLNGGNLDWLDTASTNSARRFYRALVTSGAATKLNDWTSITDWLQASGSPMYYATTNANQGAHFYRVEVRP